MTAAVWEPPAEISRDEIVSTSEAVLARPERALTVVEDQLRLDALGLTWDVGYALVAPRDPADQATGADGKQVGVFLLHGGGGDHRGKLPMARFLASRFGYTVVCMTYPGHLYLLDESRAWPGDTINPDGTVRTPIWSVDQRITPEQYELIQDRSNPANRAKWGTLFFLKAKPGTEFFDRMAAWPYAFDEAMRALCHQIFPPASFSIYAHGHSTGGPFVHLLLQRVENVAGLLGMESSPFGSLYARMLGMSWEYPFTYLTIRTWRHIAKYVGAEAGPEGAWRLPWLMEDVFEAWERARRQPQFKAEYLVTYGCADQLAAAGRAAADRLGLAATDAEALVARFRGYGDPLVGPGARPIPPLLYGIARGSRDHTLQRYQEVVLPALAAVDPAPRARVVRFQAGVHGYEKPEEGLPLGTLPAVAALWDQAIANGYYLPRTDGEG